MYENTSLWTHGGSNYFSGFRGILDAWFIWDLYEIYNSYSSLHIHNLIFTKLDETISYGNLISFAHKTKKSICYISIGQNVPDDLHEANSNYLIDCFMNRHVS